MRVCGKQASTLGNSHIIASSSSSITLGLGTARVVAAVVVVLLLFLLCATAEHGKNGGRGDGRGGVALE